MNRLSVIVPLLNEAARLPALVASLQGLRQRGAELLLADGGSSDGSPALLQAELPERIDAWVEAPRGRARQMNAGAAAAIGDVLLFLHADTTLPADAASHVARALTDPATIAGAFRTWTIADGTRPWFAPLLHLADVRSRVTQLPYGDQAMFVRADAFRAVGGFPDQPLMEDLELSRRLRMRGRIRTVPARVEVSGRRFVARPIATALAMNLFPTLYRLGVSPARLVALYRNVR